MKLRYVRTGKVYVPQYQLDNEDEWNNFKSKEFRGKNPTLLGRVSEKLSSLQDGGFKGRFWMDNDPEDRVCFTEDHLVCAFLGAAKSFYSRDIKEFNL